MDVSSLEEIGLTPAEIKVYISLLELGTAPAGEIIERSGQQNSVVHLMLHKLTDKGLISYTKKGKRREYQAVNPRHILKYLEEKKERFEQILPTLISKQGSSINKPEITNFKSIRGVKELLYELLEAGGTTHHTIGSVGNSLMLGESWWLNYHKKRAETKIFAKLLFHESLKSWKAEEKYEYCEIKYTKRGFEPLTETIIRNDKVGIIIWTDVPLGILIHHSAVAKSYESYFQAMWNKKEIY